MYVDKYTHTHTHTHTHIYIYIYICACVCVCVPLRFISLLQRTAESETRGSIII